MSIPSARRSRRSSPAFLGSALCAALALAFAPGFAPATQQPSAPFAHYYNGSERFACALDPLHLSVQARAGLGAAAIRAALAEYAEVDVDALASSAISEQGWLAAPLRAGTRA
ncbi:MAG: hypothetical protein EPO68_05850, partial [Planctomycetota bacterium]